MLEARKKHGGVGTRALAVIGILQIIGGLSFLVQNPQQYSAGVALIVIGLCLTFLLRLQVWLLFRQNSKLQEHFEAIISDDGIEISSPTAKVNYVWDGFIRYSETTNLFLVYPSQRIFNVFPKRAFSADEVDDFRELLQQKLGVETMVKSKKISPRVWAFLAVVIIAAILLVRAILNILHSAPPG